ncbi:MAG TPA: acyltransferase family protein [Gammaproteobacteria bacterium]
MPLTPDPATGRRHDIDALRVLAFGLLILYHCGMFYVADWGWHVKSAYLAEWLQYPMLFVNRWRMPLLFLVSGLAVSFLLPRIGPRELAWSRAKRLLLPLVFGMAVVVPPQAYLQSLYNGAFDGSYLAFLHRYFTFQPWPAGAFDGSHAGVTWNHLWYLPYLLAYTLVLAAFLPAINSRAGRALRDRFRALRGPWLVLAPAMPLVLATFVLAPRFGRTYDVIHDWHQHAIYFTVFLYGYLMGRDAGLWNELKRLRLALPLLAVAAFAAYLVPGDALPGSMLLHRALFDFLEYVYAWCAILAVLAWSCTLLNRPFKWLAYANEAVFPWYVLHQTITVVAGYQLARLSLGPVIEPLLVVALTVLGCFALHEFVIRRAPLLRPLFGLKAKARGIHVAAMAHRAAG